MVVAIIVAAGQGLRMRNPLPKQYLPLADIPILAYTLTAIDRCPLVDHILLVIPPQDIDFCRKNIIELTMPSHPVELIAGGSRRQESVYNALQQIDPDCDVVVIHDGVRPFAGPNQFTACINGAREHGACILGVPAYDTLKQVDELENIIDTVARDAIWLAQTPQAFRYDLIKKAHDRARSGGYLGTDDASLVERLGEKVKIFRGSRNNLKITTEEDLKIARALLNLE
jgi:2-C-methyl-D-erythritol 4-phosphate cytidylyltransferase